MTRAPWFTDDALTLWHGDALDVLADLPSSSIDCTVTSPPYYGLRDYGVDGQLGAEPSPAEYVARLVDVFAQVRRVLAGDGTVWLNIGDSYSAQPNQRKVGDTAGAMQASNRGSVGAPSHHVAGLTAKNLVGTPWRVAFALQDDGWILRNAIVWHKPNAMPESVTDRLSTTHELVFLLVKSRRYRFNLDAIREPLAYPDAADGTRTFGGKNGGAGKVGSSYRIAGGMPNVWDKTPDELKGRNPGDVWTIPTAPYPGAHFATMPLRLATRCITAGCRPGGTVLDPFHGSGTTGQAATRHGRRYVGIDLNADYLRLSLATRLAQGTLDVDDLDDDRETERRTVDVPDPRTLFDDAGA